MSYFPIMDWGGNTRVGGQFLLNFTETFFVRIPSVRKEVYLQKKLIYRQTNGEEIEIKMLLGFLT